MNQDYFLVQKMLLKLSGVSLSNSVLYKIYSYLIVLLILSYSITVFPENFKLQDNFNTFIQNSVFASATVMGSIKIIVLSKNKVKIQTIMNKLQEGNWIVECNGFAKKLSMASVMLGLSGAGLCAMFPILDDTGHYSLPFGKFPAIGNSCSYELKFFVQVLVYTVIVWIYMTTDAVYVTMLAHIYTHCKILQNTLKHITMQSVRKKEQNQKLFSSFHPSTSEMEWQFLKKSLKETVLYHNEIIDLAAQVEDIFNLTTLTVFLGLSLMVCCSMYHVSLASNFDINMLRGIEIITTAIFQIGIFSYLGNEVILESQKVANACFATNFVGTDVRFQKGLILIIQRSRKPISPTVGKFKTLSIITFVVILRGIFSYFTFLRKIGQPA